MKVCVFGAGAVGGYLAAKLLKSGRHDVSVIARGDHLRAMVSDGLTLIAPEERLVVRPHAVTDRASDLPEQDVVFVTLKAHAQPDAARDIAALLGSSSTAVFVNNGIPWWWSYRGNASAAPLPLLDPQAALWTHIGPKRAFGCVVYSSNEVVQPGIVRHTANNMWLLGEPDDSRSERLLAITRLLSDAELNAEAVIDIRTCVWTKLLRNAPLNSLCALTRLPVHELSHDPQLQRLFNSVIDEIAAIALVDGSDLSNRLEIAKAALQLGGATDGSKPGVLRPSMLQDVLSGRSLEVEPILGQVQAFAHTMGTPCPVLDVLVPLIRGLDYATRRDMI